MSRAGVLVLAAAAPTLALAGCGVPATGVVDAGEPATGVVPGARLYFIADQRLKGVVPDRYRIVSLDDAIKLLKVGPAVITEGKPTGSAGGQGPPPAAGMRSQLGSTMRITATARRSGVLVDIGSYDPRSLAHLSTGQIVCTLASARAFLHGGSPAEIPVTLRGTGGTAGPYRCPQFLSR
ncbi:hypothetical protein ACFVH6_33245 [Spirillospora sp. NPDC127200]